MSIYSYHNIEPEIGTGAYIAPSADVIGKVILGRDVSIWHGTILRGDVNWIKIGCGIMGCLGSCHLGVLYPKGLVQTYLFQSQGKKILFMSSAGATDPELKIYRDLEVDYFLAPLQGHSQIQAIAAKMASIIKPKVIIPHHHDDFFPPLSQNISVDVFREELKKLNFNGDVLEIPLFKSAQI